MIGIISDSHDNLTAIRKAVEFFNKKQVKAVLHAGDIVSPFTARAFKELSPKLYFVFGNNDGDKVTLTRWFEEIGAIPCGEFGDLTIDGLHIALLHGTNEALVKALARSGDFDVVVRGHTHDPGVKMIDGTPVINPGECSGVLSGKATVAILEIANLNVEITELEID
ncbi:phosphodiesterase [Methanosarcina sp. 2.H.T.1A.6]|uniref:metallophosphoesterase n=1 Tax=unclassified Methanosarcina TaxID=2644672 RepID=UPI000621DC95|nr:MULTISPECIES: metallophosphoesterase [unclassified Methanosarcina]KKG13243.1 phosphodiesterase [Methanosarcina sp. 2.H.T.1A.15]KKG15418.1 phosphodiesterase [Methanosarcina sp. 2.H.T.1A.3]KKG24767.1 phosphodiesterase [Methanosarcina sp. 2.H.T.1A.6]KKG26116.1 phosphodiesterase [Methanosarcina sp. 2.H.T.1A.8]